MLEHSTRRWSLCDVETFAGYRLCCRCPGCPNEPETESCDCPLAVDTRPENVALASVKWGSATVYPNVDGGAPWPLRTIVTGRNVPACLAVCTRWRVEPFFMFCLLSPAFEVRCQGWRGSVCAGHLKRVCKASVHRAELLGEAKHAPPPPPFKKKIACSYASICSSRWALTAPVVFFLLPGSEEQGGRACGEV